MTGAIVYVSSNRENPEFESRIIADMLEKRGNLRIYSVSQKPIFWGVGNVENVVIRDVGVSGFNFCRQLRMAVDMAKADYVISCEADCLYSPDYFKFVPPKLDRVYRNTNNYVMLLKQNCWYEKDSQTAFQVSGKDFLLNRLDYLLKGQSMWNTEMKNFPKEINEYFLEEWDTFKTKYACFGIKTGQGMRKQTKHGKTKIVELPCWGTIKQIKEKFL